MTNYFWEIIAMDTVPSEDGLTDVVKTVYYRRKAQDGEYLVEQYGALGCAAPDPMAYTPYDQLTFDQVCGWLNDNLNVALMDLQLDRQIEALINPPIVQLPLPWVQESTEESPSNSL